MRRNSLLRVLLMGLVVVLAVVSAGKDYYAILGVPKDANERQLKKAYRKLSLKYHPDKNPKDDQEAAAKFLEVNNAFEVLSDPEKRKIYNQFGEEGLKAGHGQGHPGGQGGGFRQGPGGSRFSFQFQDPMDIFSQFFGGGGGGGGFGGDVHGMGGSGFQRQGHGGRVQPLFRDTPYVTNIAGHQGWTRTINQDQDIALVMFYSPRCGHCREFEPEFTRAASKISDYIKVGAVNCDEEHSLCQKYGIQAHPTVMLFGYQAHRDPVKYAGERTARALLDFVSKNVASFVIPIKASNYEVFDRRYWNKPRLVVLSSKEEQSLLLKALSIEYRDRVVFAKGSYPSDSGFKDHFPMLDKTSGTTLIFQDIEPGVNDEATTKSFVYKGKANMKSLRQYIEKMLKAGAEKRKKIRRVHIASSNKQKSWMSIAENELPSKGWNVLLLAPGVASLDDLPSDVHEALKQVPSRFSSDPLQFWWIGQGAAPSKYDSLALSFGLEDSNGISLVVHRPTKKKFTSMQLQGDASQEIVSFLENTMAGNNAYRKIK